MPVPHLAIVHLRDSRPHDPSFQAELNELNDGALAAAARLGWTAELIPAAEQPAEQTIAAVAAADAVLLMGGEDVAPSFYGGPEQYEGQGTHEPLGDQVQIELVRRAVQQRQPLLGICRGQQLINVALGGTLVQHLPSSDNHRTDRASGSYVPSTLRLTEDSALLGVIDPNREVLCTHHQAVGRLADTLQVDAVALDGVIEAVSHRDAPISAVQWHPEHPADIDGLVALLHRLVQHLEHSELTPEPAGAAPSPTDA